MQPVTINWQKQNVLGGSCVVDHAAQLIDNVAVYFSAKSRRQALLIQRLKAQSDDTQGRLRRWQTRFVEVQTRNEQLKHLPVQKLPFALLYSSGRIVEVVQSQLSWQSLKARVAEVCARGEFYESEG